VLMLVCGGSLVELGFSWFSLARVLESLLFPFCGITKEMMCRGPRIADMEYRETV
jgi:hypothetical protein